MPWRPQLHSCSWYWPACTHHSPCPRHLHAELSVLMWEGGRKKFIMKDETDAHEVQGTVRYRYWKLSIYTNLVLLNIFAALFSCGFFFSFLKSPKSLPCPAFVSSSKHPIICPVQSRTAFPLYFIKLLIALGSKSSQTPDLESCSWMSHEGGYDTWTLG